MRYTEAVSLGDLIDALEKAQKVQDDDCYVTFDFCGQVPHGIASYRGYYSDLALAWGPGPLTLSDLITVLKSSVGKTFEGYKGGDFVMTRNTPIWVDNWGKCTGTAVVDIQQESYKITLITAIID